MTSRRLPDPFDDLLPGLARALNQGSDLFYSFLAHDLLRKKTGNTSAASAVAGAFKQSCDNDVTGYQLGIATRFLIEQRVTAMPDPQQFVRRLLLPLFGSEEEGCAGFFVKFNQPDMQDPDR